MSEIEEAPTSSSPHSNISGGAPTAHGDRIHSKYDHLDILFEQRRSWLCFGWHRPLVAPRWTDTKGHYVTKKQGRPRTRDYRAILHGTNEDSDKKFDYCIVVDEHTDESGWSYGHGFIELQMKRKAMRRIPRRFDLVKRRTWVKRSAADAVRRKASAKKSGVRILDPLELKQWREEARKKMDAAQSQVWELIDELDSSIRIKDLYTALLDPVALNRVSVRHLEEMQREQKAALFLYPAFDLAEKEEWVLDQGVAEEKLGIKKVAASRFQRASSITAYRNEEGEGAGSKARRLFSRMGAIAVDGTIAAGKAAGNFTSRAVDGTIAVGRAAGHMTSRAVGGVVAAIPVLGHHQSPVKEQDVHSGENPGQAAASEALDQRHVSLAAVNEKEEEEGAVRPQIDIKMDPEASGTNESGAFPSPPLPSPRSSDQRSRAVNMWKKAGLSLSLSKHKEEADKEAETEEGQPDATPMSSRTPKTPRTPSRGLASAVFARVGRWGKGLFQQVNRAEASPAKPEEKIKLPQGTMRLSLPELHTAYLHALWIYGDIEHYVDGLPAQTFGEGITERTGVPADDVLVAEWKTNPFEPVHYLAIDRKAKKIVISVRGTMETSDILTDLVSKPEYHTFAPGVSGHVHQGLLKSANYVLHSILSHLLEAVEDPELAELPILICGHSMGGGIASILAILLRVDPRVPSQVKGKIRAVCLASAAMGDRRLTWLIRGFCVSVILDCDLVPRVDVNSVALFVQEVAKASPLKQAILSLNRWCSSIKVQEKKGSGMTPLFAPGMCLWVLPGSKLTKRSGSKPADVGIDDGDAFEVNEAGLADSPLDLDRQHGFSIQSVMSNGGLMDILMQELHVPPSFPTDDDKLSRLAGSSMRPEEGASSQAGSSSPKPSLASAPFELRLIEPHHMGKILFFQKACTDHLPTSYLTAMRLLEEQQEARIKKEKDLTRIKTTLTVAKAPELQTTNSAPHTLRRDVKSSRF